MDNDTTQSCQSQFNTEPRKRIPISLTKGLITFVDVEDADLSSVGWRASKPTREYYGAYAVKSSWCKITKRQMIISLHRVILERIIGRPLNSKERVDHIDGDTLNNVRDNLRLATHQQNMQNRRRGIDNTSGYKGVSYVKDTGKWRAAIRIGGKSVKLGSFVTAEEAHEAYVAATRKHFGEFANSG